MFETGADFDYDDDLNIFTTPKPVENVQISRHLPAPEITVFKSPPSTVKVPIKRKFPGPAGLLLGSNKTLSETPETPSRTENNVIPCSQASLNTFQTPIWLKFKSDYPQLCEDYTISWIKQMARLNRLENHKAPFLGALIENVDCCDSKAPIITLKDTSGEIQGTIINDLYEKYADDLLVGSVIVLKQFGVLTTGNYNSNQYLTITLNNLVCIYGKPDDEADGDIKCTKIQHFHQDRGGVDVQIPSSQISVVASNHEEAELWKSALEGVDTDLLFDDF